MVILGKIQSCWAEGPLVALFFRAGGSQQISGRGCTANDNAREHTRESAANKKEGGPHTIPHPLSGLILLCYLFCFEDSLEARL